MDFDSISSNINWTEEGPDPEKTNQIYLAHNFEGKTYRAYFKPANKSVGPISANEYLTSKLAQLVGIPCAKVQLYKLNDDTEGYISHWIEGANRWVDDIGRDKFDDETIFNKIVCFDSWVRHRDRGGQNLVYTRNGEKYILHLIDNESALHGLTPNIGQELGIEDFTFTEHIKIGPARQLITLEGLQDFASIIQGLADTDIINIVSEFQRGAPSILSEEQSQNIIDLLIRRKVVLSQKICDWYNQQNV